MTENTQEIITKFVVEASDAISNAQELQEAMDKNIITLREATEEFGKTEAVVRLYAKAMRLDVEEQKKKSLDELTRRVTALKEAYRELGKTVQKTEVGKVETAGTEVFGKAFKDVAGEGLAEFKGTFKEAFESASAVATQTFNDIRKGGSIAFHGIAEDSRELSGEIKADTKAIADAEKERVQKAKADAKALVEAQREYVQATKQGFAIMSPAAQAYGAHIQRIKKEIVDTANASKKSWKEVAQDMARAGVPVKDINQGLKELDAGVKKTSGSMRIFGKEIKNVGDIASLVFGSILGITALTVLRDIGRYLREATEAGLEFAQAYVQLAAGTRALQREGIDITLEQVTKRVQELRAEFQVFTQKDIVQGLSLIQLYTRQLGITTDQMDEMTSAIASISILMGKDFLEAARAVSFFLSSGYGEALQRVGIISATRAGVAQEALALGINKSFNELTQQERALAGLSIVLREVASLTDEVAFAQESLWGQVTRGQATLEQTKDTIGLRLLPLYAWWIRQLERAAIGWVSLDGLMRLWYSEVAAGLIAGARAVAISFENMWRAIRGEEQLEPRKFIDLLKETQEEMRRFLLPDIFKEMGEDAEVGAKTVAESTQAVEDAFQEMADEIEKEAARVEQRIAQLERALERDLAKIGRQAGRKRLDLRRDYLQRIEDLEREHNQRMADIQSRYELNVAQTIRQFQLRRQQLIERYNEQRLKIERDYQERLRRLREDFILDLEDALRERDAREILRLIKRYNLEKDRARRERDERRMDLDSQHQQELRELERQREERLRILAEELAARLEAERIAHEYRMAENERRWAQEKDELQRRTQEQKIDRKRRADEQADEIREQSLDRLRALAEELAISGNLTEDETIKVMQMLEDYYGEGGVLPSIAQGLADGLIAMNEAIAQSVAATAAAIERAFATLQSLNRSWNPSWNQPPYTSPGPGLQEGGTLIASRPTTVTFGEGGLEAATFTPLTRIGRDEGRIFGGGALAGGGSGRLALEILLSQGLEARIVDEALNDVADIIMNTQRKR